MNIGQAASASGVSANMIRHYEELGLLPEAQRTESGYRQYEEPDVHSFQFIRRSRELGFALTEIGELVGLWQDRTRPSREVRALAEVHIKELEQKAEEILAMKSALQHLVRCCGDERPDCFILDGLAGHGQVPGATSANPTKGRRLRQQETPSAGPRTAI